MHAWTLTAKLQQSALLAELSKLHSEQLQHSLLLGCRIWGLKYLYRDYIRDYRV